MASLVNGLGAGAFFPANNSAVMKAAPPRVFGISSGMLRTFANVGMVFSFSLAIVLASRSIPRQLAFAIFVGSTSLHGELATAFASGLHSAFYGSMVLMAVAALLSATRGARSLSLQQGSAAALARRAVADTPRQAGTRSASSRVARISWAGWRPARGPASAPEP